MKIYKITEASEYLGVSINTLKTLANNGNVKSFKTTGEHRCFRKEDEYNLANIKIKTLKEAKESCQKYYEDMIYDLEQDLIHVYEDVDGEVV